VSAARSPPDLGRVSLPDTMAPTSLAAQLAALRPVPTHGANREGGGLRTRPSLLFSASEAADLDAEAIHSIGLSGLGELERHDPALHKFEKLLFSRSAASFRRESQSVEVLKVVDQSIKQLLQARPHPARTPISRCYPPPLALPGPHPAGRAPCGPLRADDGSANTPRAARLQAISPFFLLRPAHKVLEFLIRAYAVHEHAPDDLLACALPFHSTPQFVRVVHLLTPTGKWGFLAGVKKTGSPLSKQVLPPPHRPSPRKRGARTRAARRA
jgi:U3 small nucleolar RNA-associated protein 10